MTAVKAIRVGVGLRKPFQSPAVAHLPDDWLVEVSHAPLVHRQVPHFPELDDVVGVPPVGVEAPVRKLQDLADRVQEGVKQEVEPSQPNQVIGNLEFSNPMALCFLVFWLNLPKNFAFRALHFVFRC